MRRVLVINATTLDGFYAGEGGDPMVLDLDAAFDAYNLQRMRSASTVLLGRASFELFGSFWPSVADAPEDSANPALSETNREFSRLYGRSRKLVVSDTLEVPAEHPWASTTEVVPRDEATARISAERGGEDGDIVIYGSHILWNALLHEGLVDELHLLVGPNAIAGGIPLFTDPARLTLADARRLSDSDNVLHIYRPAS
jgi:dihydrofolate reductase